MNLRPATAEDLPAILAIYNEVVLTSTANYDYEPQTLEKRQTWFENLQRGNYPVLVAVDAQQRVVGWAALNPFHVKPGYRFTTENSVYVASDQRGKGLGRQLLQGLIEAGQARGYHSIVALIDSRSEVSLRLHTALGFQQAGHLRQVGFKFDEWLDLIYMQRIL